MLTFVSGDDGSSSSVIKSASLVRVEARAVSGVLGPFLGAGDELLNRPDDLLVGVEIDFGVWVGLLVDLGVEACGRAGVDPPAGLKNERIDPFFC